MREKKAKTRFFIFISVLGGLLLILMVYLFSFMVLLRTDNLGEIKSPPLVERGLILDRNGEELAMQPELYAVEAWLPHMENPEETSALLAPILEIDRQVLLKKFEGESKAVILKHQIAPAESARLETLKKDGKLKGIYLKPKLGRIYPKRELGCHVVGYVNVDNRGMAGIEYTFDEDLSPQTVSSADAVYGRQIVLTIDVKLQFFMDRIALEAQEKTKADSVMLLVLGAKSGEILAYSSIPRFDPNEFNKYSDSERMNRPALAAFEPGSTLKIFTIASLLETGAVHAADEFRCDGFFRKALPGGEELTIRCMGTHGEVTPQKIIQYSCNAGACYASEKIQSDLFYEKLKNFGFGQKTGIALGGESSGVFAPPSRWSNRSKATIAFGQEISVSAVQMAAAATVFANDGVLLKPIIVKRVLSPDGRTVLKNFTREPVRRVLSPENARLMLAMMETAVEPNGSAAEAKIKGVRVAAKTGTAQVSDPVGGGYSQDKYIASIIGLFPAEDPTVILYIVVENPKEGSVWGSRVAAPRFQQAGEEIVRYLDIPKAGEKIFVQSWDINIPKPESLVVGGFLPDLTGLPKRSLSVLLEAGLTLAIKGEGYVVRQDPPAGTRIEKGMKVTLLLE